ncbi:MAG: DNA repair protein RadA, partial [Clostridiales bacterium]|nr:DNA repair protein RadA [Clostridiales bacterium]
AMLLLAVLEKRGGLRIGGCDAYINVVAGLNLNEPAADLAAVLALASSFRDRPVPEDLAAVGEVGLTGEIRSVSVLGQRLSEIHRLGFYKCLVPARGVKDIDIPGMQLIPVRNIREALAVLA